MGALPHPTGQFRAYKKINGVEYQHYFPTLEEAQTKQQNLDTLSSLNPPKHFWNSGAMRGLSIRQDSRPGRNNALSFCLQCMGIRRDITYRGNFEKTWKEAKNEWKRLRGLSPADMVCYKEELKSAKQFYMQRVGELEAP